jgi:hypothetical protein
MKGEKIADIDVMRAWKNVYRPETAEIIFLTGNNKTTNKAARVAGICVGLIMLRDRKSIVGAEIPPQEYWKPLDGGHEQRGS